MKTLLPILCASTLAFAGGTQVSSEEPTNRFVTVVLENRQTTSVWAEASISAYGPEGSVYISGRDFDAKWLVIEGSDLQKKESLRRLGELLEMDVTHYVSKVESLERLVGYETAWLMQEMTKSAMVKCGGYLHDFEIVQDLRSQGEPSLKVEVWLVPVEE
jgi:hypothetical protein